MHIGCDDIKLAWILHPFHTMVSFMWSVYSFTIYDKTLIIRTVLIVGSVNLSTYVIKYYEKQTIITNIIFEMNL